MTFTCMVDAELLEKAARSEDDLTSGINMAFCPPFSNFSAMTNPINIEL